MLFDMVRTVQWLWLVATACLLTCGCAADRPADSKAAGVYYIGGRTQLPGAYPLPKGGVSLRQALTLAQAYPPYDESLVIVFHYEQVGAVMYENRTCVMARPLMESGVGDVQVHPDDRIMYTTTFSGLANTPLHGCLAHAATTQSK